MNILEQRKNAFDGLTTRAMPTIPNSFDAETHSVRVIVATDEPTEVLDWERWQVVKEVLLMDGMELPENKQTPLLDSHDRSTIEKVLGSLREYTATGKSVEARAFFTSVEEGANAETKVREGHVTDLSAGYKSLESVWIPENQKQTINNREFAGPVKVTKRWRMKEGSFTPIGADEMSKVRASLVITDEIRQLLITKGLSQDATDGQAMEFLQRQLKTNTAVGGEDKNKNNLQTNHKGERTMEPGQETTPTAAEVKKSERERVSQIEALAKRLEGIFPNLRAQLPNFDEMRTRAVNDDWTTERFSNEVFSKMPDSQAVPIADDSGSQTMIGMSRKDLGQYSVLRAIQQLLRRGQLDGVEKEASLATARLAKRDVPQNGFIIPPDMLFAKRELTGMDASKGGYLVGTEVRGGELIELLRNKPLVAQMGARTISGLVGNLAIPKVAGGAIAYWLSSGGGSTKSNQTFAQLGLTPHRLVGETAYDKELLFQASIDVESFVREDLMTILAIEKDRAAINGLGANGEPLGILNTSGLATPITFGAAATFAKVIEFETNVATNNADVGKMGYLTTPAVRGKWKGTPKVTNQAVFLWEKGDAPGEGSVNGYRALATKQMPNDLVLFGNFADFLFAEWAGVDVVVDGVTLASNGQIRIVITLWCDHGVRHQVSFCKSTDSGAQ